MTFTKTGRFIPVLFMIILGISSIHAELTLPGITAFYPFEDATANDVIGTYHGQVFGATQTSGIYGNAFYFDGSDDYIYIPRSISDDFSIVFWVYTTQTAATNIPGVDPSYWDTHQWWVGNGLVDAEIDTERDDFGTSLLGCKASFGKGDESLRKDFTIESTSDINDGKWHQIAAVREICSGEMKLYVDGVLEATGTGTSNSLNDPTVIGIGNNPCDISVARRYFNGKIDEIQIYSRVLTDNEVQALYRDIKNRAPELTAVGSKTINEHQELSFTVNAMDPDGDSITCTIVGAPVGAVITPEGAFTWTPEETQGPGSYTFNIEATDGALIDSESITVTVEEVNTAPVMEAIINRNMDELTTLSFVAVASDSDIPAQMLSFSLVNAPVGSSITPGGTFTWTPDETQGPGSYTFNIEATDGALKDTVSITITVTEGNSIPVPEFNSIILPAAMIIMFIGAVLFIRKSLM